MTLRGMAHCLNQLSNSNRASEEKEKELHGAANNQEDNNVLLALSYVQTNNFS